jgi:hypothetical protein
MEAVIAELVHDGGADPAKAADHDRDFLAHDTLRVRVSGASSFRPQRSEEPESKNAPLRG